MDTNSQENSLQQVVHTILEPITNSLRRASLIQHTLTQHKLSKGELARLLRKSPSYVSNHLRLLALPEIIKDALLSNMISEGHARALSFLDNGDEVLAVFEEIIKHNSSVRDAEAQVNKRRTNKREYGKVAEDVAQGAQKLEQQWGIRVTAKRRSKTIHLIFSFPLGIVYFRKLQKIIALLLQHGDK